MNNRTNEDDISNYFQASVRNYINNYVREANNAAFSNQDVPDRPPPPPQRHPRSKRRWGGCLNMYWCFGSHKNSKRISDTPVLPPPPPVVPGAAELLAELPNNSEVVTVPAVPPSSPLPSDPPSAVQTPGGLTTLSLPVNGYAPDGPAPRFSIGPYAYETQLVSPPVFSAYTTEPSTAAITPPPESVQHTTPSSPEVPFAQLLSSSLSRPRRNSGTNPKFTMSHYEFQAYQVYPASPGGHIISPGSAISNSGTSSPFPDKGSTSEVYKGVAPKFLKLEHFTTRKWGSRLGSGTQTPEGASIGSWIGSGSITPDGYGKGSTLGSGSITPDGARLGSRLVSGSVTPDGAKLGSRLGSGSITPDKAGLGSKSGSGTLTPDGTGRGSKVGSGAQTPDGTVQVSTGVPRFMVPNGSGPAFQDVFLLEYQISEVASLANSENESRADETITDHRVSFELTGEDVARCLASKSFRARTEFPQEEVAGQIIEVAAASTDAETTSAKAEDQCYQKHRSISFGSIKEFNFDSSKGDATDKSAVSAEWWANEKNLEKEANTPKNWSFFPVLRPEVN